MLHLLVVSLIASLGVVGHTRGLTMDAALSTGRYMYTVLVVINTNANCTVVGFVSSYLDGY